MCDVWNVSSAPKHFSSEPGWFAHHWKEASAIIGFTRSPRGRLPRGIACLLEPVFHQQKPAKHLHHSSSAILCRWFNVLRGSDPVLTAVGILGDNIAASVAKNAAIPGAAQ